MLTPLTFYKDLSTGIEIVCFDNSSIAYEEHTHTSHFVLGIVKKGEIKVVIDSKEYICKQNQYFIVAANTAHSIKNISKTYSMLSICIKDDSENKSIFNKITKEIIGDPKVNLSISDLSEKIHVSEYHLIRKFKKDKGITPHKFMMQCRIRKAQKLLEKGTSVIDTAFILNFTDQSHLDRVFKKIVGITPEQYVKSAILSNAD